MCPCPKTSSDQWLSKENAQKSPEELYKTQSAGFYTQFLTLRIAPKTAFLKNSHMLLLLLDPGSHFEKQRFKRNNQTLKWTSLSQHI